MVISAKSQQIKSHGRKLNGPQKSEKKPVDIQTVQEHAPEIDGVVYSRHLNYCPFTAPSLDDYVPIIGNERAERVHEAAKALQGHQVLELNATVQGGGVAEMLFSSVPFINNLGVEMDWKIISGNEQFFECTKGLHNLLQGMQGSFTQEMERAYYSNITDCARRNIVDDFYDVVMVNDPQPLGLARHLRQPGGTWLWRCHIDIEENPMDATPGLWDFMTNWIQWYDAAIFSAAHYVVTRWPLPSFIIPPFIDPLSEKNRELSPQEIDEVLDKYELDTSIPTIVQVGRFDPWKGIERTIAVFRYIRKEMKCQLILAGGMASDDPEGGRIFSQLQEDTKNDDYIRILNLPMDNREENWEEVNALQRSADVIMQPSTREGFGLVITEALWKAKPVIAANVGAIPLQIRDGDTGYFYESPQKTGQRVIHLLKNPKAAVIMGQTAREYVSEHFLMPDRIADYLMAMEITMKRDGQRPMPPDSIISFHPWFKMSKRKS